jgi:hypothetical protein
MTYLILTPANNFFKYIILNHICYLLARAQSFAQLYYNLHSFSCLKLLKILYSFMIKINKSNKKTKVNNNRTRRESILQLMTLYIGVILAQQPFSTE